MIFSIDIKLIFAICAILTAVFGSFLPYIRDVFKKKTKPHAYTWLIWTITQGVAAAGLLYGKGGWGFFELLIGTFFVFLIFLISLKYGTKNITKSDTIVLIFALLSIAVWLKMNSPILAVFMVSVIDFIGYFRTFRKSFLQPRSETVLSWFGFFCSDIFAILALYSYNFLTLTYLVTIAVGNLIIISICLFRRQIVK